MGVRFSVLGGVQARRDDRVVDLGPARRVRVLAALLVDAGRPVTLDVLVERVWDGHPPVSAVSTVQAHVSRLRSALGSPTSIRWGAAGYRLETAAGDVDADGFTAAHARAEQIAAAGDAVLARVELDRALDLWRGRPYAGVEADFVGPEVSRLDEIHLRVRELAAEVDLVLGRHAAVAADLGAWVASYPFRERLCATWMLALHRSGRHPEALQAYQQHRVRLAEELGVDPGAPLRQLHADLLRQDPALESTVDPPTLAAPTVGTSPPAADAVTATAASAPGPTATDPASAVPPPEPFVGRHGELSRVVAALRAAADGTPRAVAVVGEAGIGKSRLLEAAAEWAQAQGQTVAWGRCWPHAGSPALWPWLQMLRELAERVSPELLHAALRGRGATLISLVPDLVPDLAPDLAPGPAAALDPGHGRGAGGVVAEADRLEQAEVRVFDALLHVLGVLGEHAPLLIVLDDGQWADPLSMRMLEYAATHLRRERVTVAVTVRSPLDEGEGDLAVLGLLARCGRTERVDLAGLDAADVGELVRRRVGRVLDAASAAALHARTEGNPFYVGEIARLVAAREATGDTGGGVPDSVRGVIRGRFARLDPGDVAVLTAAAVVGRSFDTVLLGELSVVGDAAEVEEALERAAEAGLVRPEPGTLGRYRFSHGLLRETLLERARPTFVRRVHRRVADVLAARPGARPDGAGQERIAGHYLAGGAPEDRHRAVVHLLHAADAASARGSLPELAPLLQRAAEVADELPAEDEDLRRTVKSRQVAAELLVRGPTRWDPVAPVPDLDATTSARDVLTAVHGLWARRFGEGRPALAEQAAATLDAAAHERDDDLLRVGAAMTRGYDSVQRGRFRDAVTALETAQALLPRVDVPPMIFGPHPVVGAPAWRAMCLLVLGDVRAGAARAEAHDRTRQLGDPVADAYLEVIDLYWWVWGRRPGQAWEAGRTARASIDRLDLAVLRTLMDMPLAWAQSFRDPAAAARAADEARDDVERPAGLAFRPFLRGLHADVLRRGGDTRRALGTVDAALQEAEDHGAHLWDAELHRTRALSLADRGAPGPEVDAAYRRAREIAAGQHAQLFLDRLPPGTDRSARS